MNELSKHQVGAVLFTANVKTMASFYEGVAGLVPFRVEEGHVRLEKGAFRLTVHKLHPRPSKAIAEPARAREGNPLKLAFQVEDLAEARRLALKLGGALYAAEREWHYEGMTACDGVDPDGNVFQLFTFQPAADR